MSESEARQDNTDVQTDPPSQSGPARLFASTLWSVVLQAGSESEPESAAALERLCRQYWHPLHVFARRRGHSEHDAQDLTQGFLAELLASRSLTRADPARGRFRTFLLSAFCNYLAKQHREQSAQKRGGGQAASSIEDESAGEAVRNLTDGLTPEFHYERSWALAVLESVMARLREEYTKAGRLELFEALHPGLSGGPGHLGYAELGRQVGLSEGTVAVAMHRMRRRYGEYLREEIAATVATPEDADAELRHLLKVVSMSPSPSGSR